MKKILFTCLTFLFAAQIANAQPAIQNMRVIDKTNPTLAASVSSAGAVKVDGSAVTQPVSMSAVPTGGSTAALQTSGNASLTSIDGKITAVNTGAVTIAAMPNEGQQTMVNSISVALASNQSALPVTQSGTWASRTQDGAGTAITSTGGALDVNIASGASSGTQYTEGDTDASITGTAAMWEDAGNVLTSVSSAKPLPVSIAAALAAGTNNIGDVDVLTVPADPFGVNADAASATGSISAKLRFIASTGIPITGTVTVGSHAVTNAGTFLVQENGALLTSNQLIDDVVHSGDAVVSKYALIGGVLDDTATVAVTENQAQSLRITGARGTHVNLRNNAGTEIGTSGAPVRTDPTGSTTQPVSGTVTANAGTGTFTVDSELPAAAALADAASATPTTTTQGAVQLVMNATTLDRQRAVVAALDSTGTGIAAAGLVGQLDDTATAAVTENQFAPARISSRRALLVEGVASGTNLPVSQATASALNAQVVGNVANGASDSGNPIKIGGVGRTTNPTAVTDGQRVDAMFDKLGKQVTVSAMRALKGKQKTTITSSTSETTIVTALASTFLDVYAIIISNTSATAVDVTIKDSTAGSTVAIITVPADDVRGFTLGADSAIPQTTVNNNWTATCSASVASVEITALYVQNL